MYTAHVLVVFLGLVSACIGADVASPGVALFWTHAATGRSDAATPMHITKGVRAEFVGTFLKEKKMDYHAVAVLAPAEAGSSFLENDAITGAFKASPHQTTINTIYKSDSGVSLGSSVAGAKGEVQEVTLAEFAQALGKKNVGGNVPTYRVSVHNSASDVAALASLSSASAEAKVLFVSYTEPQASAPAAATNFQQKKRALAGDDGDDADEAVVDTTDSHSIYYSPEGATWSMYYADTYLYITPDIFTGLMTGLFMLAVILVGLNCMGQIQGITYFYDKLPPVGREA